MAAITFDTIKYMDELIAVGVPEQQAKVQSKALKEAVDDVISSDLATKADILETENKLTEKINTLEIRLIKWAIAMHAISFGLIFALFKLFLP